jgi:hypothetical protein
MPCRTITIYPDGTITCGGDYSVSASATVPCIGVQRNFYPRGLVANPVDFQLAGPFESTGSASSRQWCTANIRNYTLQVRWAIQSDPPPIWDFQERDWNEEPGQAVGFAVSHIYDTSSWGLPENGPSLNGLLELPAYQVRVATHWSPYVRRTWEERRVEPIAFECGDDPACQTQQEACEELEPGADEPDEDCFDVQWEPVDTGWQVVDLTAYGYPTRYYQSQAVIDVSMPPADIPPVPVSLRQCGVVPVPVIEVQSLLNAPGTVP